MNSQSLKGPLGWSLAAIITMVIFCVYAATTIVAPFIEGMPSERLGANTDHLIEKYNQQVIVDIARFNGRSAFFKPIRIAPPYTPPPPPPRQDPPDPIETIHVVTPDPAPPIYMGPDLIAIIGDQAWFRGRGTGADAVIRLEAGEERDGLRLVQTLPPAMVIVEHRTGEYEIELFSNEENFFIEEAPPVVQDSFLEEVDG